MAYILALMIMIIGLIVLIKLDLASGKRSVSVCADMVLAFLKSVQVLFWVYLDAVAITICILQAYSNHFIIDYYIMVLFSSLILITYHILKLSRYSFARF